jgi:hypothetical protein
MFFKVHIQIIRNKGVVSLFVTKAVLGKLHLNLLIRRTLECEIGETLMIFGMGYTLVLKTILSA